MTIIYTLLVGHFVADFLCQSDWMALNKSKRWDALVLHVAIYTAVMGVMTYALAPTLVGWLLFVLVTALSHFATDAVTSRITSRLWFIEFYPRADHSPNYYGAYPLYARVGATRHWFFVAIGADQLLHYITLFVTADWWL